MKAYRYLRKKLKFPFASIIYTDVMVHQNSLCEEGDLQFVCGSNLSEKGNTVGLGVFKNRLSTT